MATPTSMPPMPASGGMIPQITQYAYPGDKSDTLTRQKLGFKDNTLTPHAAALTDSMAAQIHARPGDAIRLSDGRVVYYADRAPEANPRVDLYQPQGFDKTIADHQNVANLGGGAQNLSGQQLASIGEANAKKFAQQNSAQSQAPSVAAPNPVVQSAPQSQPQDSSQRSAAPPTPSFGLAPFSSMPQNPPQMNVQSADTDPSPVQNYALGRLFSSHPLIAALLGMNNPNQSVD